MIHVAASILARNGPDMNDVGVYETFARTRLEPPTKRLRSPAGVTVTVESLRVAVLESRDS